MLKQSPSRSQRSKGYKVKHGIQICVLLAICIWLLYQVKHAYDKKAYGENSAEVSEMVQGGKEIIRLGRKHLHPRNENNGDEEEDEESKGENDEDEGRGGIDDETNGHDQEKTEGEEYEQGEDLIDEEDMEREKEIEEQETKGKENQIEDASLLEHQDPNRADKNSQQAQEELYKKDDASSAVAQNTRTINAEAENIVLRKVKEEKQAENDEKNELEQENFTNKNEVVSFDGNDSGSNVGEGETAEKRDSENAVGIRETSNDFNMADTSTKATSNEQSEESSSATLMQVETHGSFNGIDKLPELLEDQNVASNDFASSLKTVLPEQTSNSKRYAGNEKSYFSSTLPTMTKNSDTAMREVGSFIDSESVARKKVMNLDDTAGTEDGPASTAFNKNDDRVHSGDFNANVGTDEAKEVSASFKEKGIADAVQNAPFDSSESLFYQEYRKDQTDLVALPEVESRTSNSKDKESVDIF